MAYKQDYNVLDFYSETGFPQAIARSSLFNIFVLSAIVFHAVWLAIDADHNAASSFADQSIIFSLLPILLFVVFAFEITIRLLAFKQKANCLKDGWFIFDALLVVLMPFYIFRVGNSPVFPIIQVFRLAKLSRSAAELGIIAKAYVVALRSIFFIICLQWLLTYVFALIFVYGTRFDYPALTKDGYFETVIEAMHTLVIYGCFFNMTEFSMMLQDQAGWLECVFWIYCVLSFMNLVLFAGVVGKIVSEVSETEKEALTIQYVANQLRSLSSDTAEHANGLTKKGVKEVLAQPQVIALFQMMTVDTSMANKYLDMIFEGDDTNQDGGVNNEEKVWTYEEIAENIGQLRSCNTACAAHMFALRKQLQAPAPSSLTAQDIQKVIATSLEPLYKKMESTEKALANIKSPLPGGVQM